MKKSVKILVALVLVFCLTACDAITDYHEGNQQTRPTRIEATVPEDVPEEELFTVTLRLNGESIRENAAFYATFLNMEIYAQWNDGYSCVIAPFNEEGVAKAAGLDGTYSVTLSAVPVDYIYDVNVYQATNDERQIVIDLYRLYDAEAESYGDGSGVYFPYVKEFSFEGVYEIQIDSPDDVVYCRYMPGRNGVYVIESWESTIDDKVNPKVDIWNGSVAAAWYNYTLEDGGSSSESGYTTNFKYEVSVDEAELGNVFIFGLRATAKDGVYPIKVKVAIRRVGSLLERYYRETMLPKEIIRQAPNGTGFSMKVGKETANGRFLFDTTLCRLWPVAEGGDGFYHLYDEEAYASTGGWGPTLFANVGRFGDSVSLSVKQGNKFFDYRMFMRGFESLAEYRVVDTDALTGDKIWGSELCSGLCTCNHTKLESASEPTGEVTLYACMEGCETCHEQCIQVTPAQWGAVGYCEGANSGGYYPVTEELKTFLQMYAENRNLFCDGTGSWEELGYDADQDSMWLWDVIYYAGDEGGLCQMKEVVKDCFERNPNNFPSVS